jgi:hypothetical protein
MAPGALSRRPDTSAAPDIRRTTPWRTRGQPGRQRTRDRDRAPDMAVRPGHVGRSASAIRLALIVPEQVVARRMRPRVGTRRIHAVRVVGCVRDPGAARPMWLAHPSQPLCSLSTWCRRFVPQSDFGNIPSYRRTRPRDATAAAQTPSCGAYQTSVGETAADRQVWCASGGATGSTTAAAAAQCWYPRTNFRPSIGRRDYSGPGE